jgi:hypothetical protein
MKKYDSVEQLIEEIRTGKTLLVCKKHNFIAAKRRESGNLVPMPPEPNGCPECWRVYNYTQYAMTPAKTRQEGLDEYEQVIKKAVEFDKTGKFGSDFELYDTHDPRFSVQFEKDAYPDKEEK